MERIYRSYRDIEVVETATFVKCPYCGHEFSEYDSDCCGRVYVIQCEECEKEFEMYFDAD